MNSHIKTLNQFIEEIPTLTVGDFNPEESSITKIWSLQDVIDRLKEQDYAIPDEDTLNAIFMDALSSLGDCTDYEWQQIDEAIESYKDDLTYEV